MELAEELLRYSRLCWDRRLTAGTGGNMSARQNDRVLITPAGSLKHFLGIDDLITLNLAGEKIAGRTGPSSEYSLHLAIYNCCPDVGAVFHAHPPFATAVAVNGRRLPERVLPETALLLSPITYVPYRTPGTAELSDAFEPGLKNGSRVFIMQNHGVAVAADSIEAAFARLDVLEHLAKVTWLCGQTAQTHALDEKEIEKLRRMAAASDR